MILSFLVHPFVNLSDSLGGNRRMGAVSAKSENLAVDEKESIPSEPEFCIEAGSVGNVARFINHSCDPNLFVQCVVSSHHDLRLARIILVASDNIPPNQESCVIIEGNCGENGGGIGGEYDEGSKKTTVSEPIIDDIVEETVIVEDVVTDSRNENVFDDYNSMENENENKLFLVPTSVNDNGDEVVVFDEELVREGSEKWKHTVFGSEKGLNFVIDQSPWMVNGRPFFVQKWDPEVTIVKLGRPIMMDQMTVAMCNKGVDRWSMFGNQLSAISVKCNERPRTTAEMDKTKVNKNTDNGKDGF
nr:histone-lysine N-methyltransferase, H3 lysine-9 specific SUVH4-like [Tanacetum cinerariifolium]